MANIIEHLLDMYPPEPKRSNWDRDFIHVTSADWGYVYPVFVDEIIANSRVRWDVRAAFSTNPTISPVLSRAKVQFTAWWVPSRLYIPALRDGVHVKPGKTDYSFPTVNFSYSDLSVADSFDGINGGNTTPYIPVASIFHYLRMWAPNFSPITFKDVLSSNPDAFKPYPEGKNAIPLLAYYDIYRNFIMNQQSDYTPMRTRAFRPSISTGRQTLLERDAYDRNVSRNELDTLFNQVRSIGSSYPQGDGNFDVTGAFVRTIFSVGTNRPNDLFPKRDVIEIYGDGSETPTDLFMQQDYHYGLLRATYGGDYFTAYLSNENVQYERSIARVQVGDDNTITMESIYASGKIQNFIRRSAFQNSDYADYVDAEYGIRPSVDLTKPMFLGAVSSMMTFNDVVAQAQTSDNNDVSRNTALGSRASLGQGRVLTGRYNGKRPLVQFTSREPGYLMVLMHIVPEVSYADGFSPIYDKRRLGALYYPAFERIGYQDKQMKYICEFPSIVLNENDAYVTTDVPFRVYNTAYAQEVAWMEYMASHDIATGQMSELSTYRSWVFIRELAHDFANALSFHPEDIYVQPEVFNKVFANQQNIDNIQCFLSFDYRSYQPMSHRFLSFK